MERGNGAGDISKSAGNDFIGSEFSAIGAARTAGAKLVARLDLIKRSRFRVIKFHRIRRITAQDGVLREVDGNCLPFVRRRQRSVDGIARRVDVAYQSSEAVPLPFFALARLFLGDVCLLNGNDRGGGNGFPVIGRIAARPVSPPREKRPRSLRLDSAQSPQPREFV